MSSLSTQEAERYVVWACARFRAGGSVRVLARALCLCRTLVEESGADAAVAVARAAWPIAVDLDPTSLDGARVRWATLLLFGQAPSDRKYQALAEHSFQATSEKPGWPRALATAALAGPLRESDSVATAATLRRTVPGVLVGLDPALSASALALRQMIDLGGDAEWKDDARAEAASDVGGQLTMMVHAGAVPSVHLRRIGAYLEGAEIRNWHQLRSAAHSSSSRRHAAVHGRSGQ